VFSLKTAEHIEGRSKRGKSPSGPPSRAGVPGATPALAGPHSAHSTSHERERAGVAPVLRPSRDATPALLEGHPSDITEFRSGFTDMGPGTKPARRARAPDVSIEQKIHQLAQAGQTPSTIARMLERRGVTAEFVEKVIREGPAL
jgi:hypothetical protein